MISSRSFVSTGLRWLWVTIVVLIIDLSSKYLLLQYFSLGDTVSLLPMLNIRYINNYGAAFSFLADEESCWQRWLLISVSISACLVILLLMYREKAINKTINIAHALIIGGTLGNIFDRLWRGFVVDMIDFYISNWHFATFNFADMAICIGTIIIVFKQLLLKLKV